MTRLDKNNFSITKYIEQTVGVFSYFDLIVNQLKADSKKSFSHALFIFKKLSENLAGPNLLENNQSWTPLFAEELKSCKGKLSEIIMLLQFEDILSQKFDHISQINRIVVNNLQKDSELPEESKALLLNKIIQLNSAQLEYIKQEHEEITSELKDKLERIYKASANILSAINGQDEKQKTLLNLITSKIDESMATIRSFLDTDMFKLSPKIDALIKIVEGLDLNISFSKKEKIQHFDLQKLLNIYTIESERMVFYKVFKETGNYINEKTSSKPEANNIDFF